MGRTFALVLSGCGFKDGTEIIESVSAMIALGQSGATFKCFAPDAQFSAINHLTGNPDQHQRSVISEAARIARGDVHPLQTLKSNEFDGLVFPGGYGAAKVLCDWASKGAACSVLPDVARVITEFYNEAKPICAICIAPVLLGKVLGSKGVTLTVGNDPETSRELEKTGAHHIMCPVTDYLTDRENKIITTPAYMYDTQPHLVFQGIQGAIREFVGMS